MRQRVRVMWMIARPLVRTWVIPVLIAALWAQWVTREHPTRHDYRQLQSLVHPNRFHSYEESALSVHVALEQRVERSALGWRRVLDAKFGCSFADTRDAPDPVIFELEDFDGAINQITEETNELARWFAYVYDYAPPPMVRVDCFTPEHFRLVEGQPISASGDLTITVWDEPIRGTVWRGALWFTTLGWTLVAMLTFAVRIVRRDIAPKPDGRPPVLERWWVLSAFLMLALLTRVEPYGGNSGWMISPLKRSWTSGLSYHGSTHEMMLDPSGTIVVRPISNPQSIPTPSPGTIAYATAFAYWEVSPSHDSPLFAHCYVSASASHLFHSSSSSRVLVRTPPPSSAFANPGTASEDVFDAVAKLAQDKALAAGCAQPRLMGANEVKKAGLGPFPANPTAFGAAIQGYVGSQIIWTEWLRLCLWSGCGSAFLVFAIRRVARPREPWLCRSCGYDLRNTPDGESCPECGAV